VLAGLFWGLRTQMTTPLGDFVGRAPPTTDEPQREAVDVELTFTPGEEAAAKGVEPPVPQVAAPVVEGFADPGENLSAKIQDEVRAYGETVRTRMDADLRTQADALVKSLPPPTFVELPPRSASADTPPVPAPPAPK